MRHLALAIAVYLTVAVQSSVLSWEGPLVWRPFLPALTLLAITLWVEGASVLVWSAVLGLLLDGLSSERLGMQMSLAVLLAGMLQWLTARRRSTGVMSAMALAFLVTLLWRILSPVLVSALAGRATDALLILASASRDAAATGGLAGLLAFGARPILKDTASRPDSSGTFDQRWNLLAE